MRVIVGFMVLFGVVLSFLISRFEFSPSLKAVFISVIVGIIVFIVTSGLIYSSLSSKNREKTTEERIRKQKRKANAIGIIIMLIFSILFFNFYLYIKSMMGNDLLVSLDVEDQNINIKNGEEINIDIKAKVLTNPFCNSECLLVLEDLSSGEKIFEENIVIKLSSPLLKEYSITPNDEKFGQKLYKVNLECNSIDTRFCYSKSPTKSRTKIISVDYELNDIQSLIKDNLKNNTEVLNREFYYVQNKLGSFNLNNPYLDLSDLEKEYVEINNSLYEASIKLDVLNKLYLSQEYSQLGTEIYSVSDEIVELTDKFNLFNFSFYGNISTYNSLVENLTNLRDNISYLEEYPFSSSSIDLAESFVENFNEFVLNMKGKDTLDNKLEGFKDIQNELFNLTSLLENETGINLENFSLGVSIDSLDLEKIVIDEINYSSSFNLGEPSPICCLYGECYSCIDDSSVNYPVILVHGHSFNEKLSAELSMESFGEMARELEKEGYLDAGYFYVSKYDEDSKGYLGKVNASIVVEATYYIDSLVTEEDSFIFDSKWESINTYSARLNEVVSNVKYITGKDKVIIVSHSMGGLVTRNYIKEYGEESLDRVILVGIPNHGVDGFVLNYCAVFGADVECSEMNETSDFIYNLNSAPLPTIPVYNFVGIGCSWEGEDGDGIVKSSSAYLNGTENIYVNGTCSGVDFFHVRMIKPTKHPEIYKIIKDLIKD